MKREKLKEATITVKQIEETESQIFKLDTLIAKLSDKDELRQEDDLS